jgi:hypothetical protein
LFGLSHGAAHHTDLTPTVTKATGRYGRDPGRELLMSWSWCDSSVDGSNESVTVEESVIKVLAK